MNRATATESGRPVRSTGASWQGLASASFGVPALSHGICVLSPSGQTDMLNDYAARLLGVTQTGVRGIAFSCFVHEDDRDLFFSEMQRAQQCERRSFTLSIQSAYGAVYPADAFLTSFNQSAASPSSLFLVFRIMDSGSVSERTATGLRDSFDEHSPGSAPEAGTADGIQPGTSLRHTERRLRMLLESGPEGIAVVDGLGVIQCVNEAGAAMLGYQTSDLEGHTAVSFLTNLSDLLSIRRIVADPASLHSSSLSAMLSIRKHDGGPLWLDVNESPLSLVDGSTAYLLAFRPVFSGSKRQSGLV